MRKSILALALSCCLLTTSALGAEQSASGIPAFEDISFGYAGQWSIAERVAFESQVFASDASEPEARRMRALAFYDMHLPNRAIAELLEAAARSNGTDQFLAALQAAARLDASHDQANLARIMEALQERGDGSIDAELSAQLILTEYLAAALSQGAMAPGCAGEGTALRALPAELVGDIRPDWPLTAPLLEIVECMTRQREGHTDPGTLDCVWAVLGSTLSAPGGAWNPVAVYELAAKLVSKGHWPAQAECAEMMARLSSISPALDQRGVPPLDGLLAFTEAMSQGALECPTSGGEGRGRFEGPDYAPRGFFASEEFWNDLETLRRLVLVDAVGSKDWRPDQGVLEALEFAGYAVPLTGLKAHIESLAAQTRRVARQALDTEREARLNELNRIIQRFRDYRDLTPTNIDALRDALRQQFGDMKPDAHEVAAHQAETEAAEGLLTVLDQVEQYQYGAPLFDRRARAPRWPVTLLVPVLQTGCGDAPQQFADYLSIGLRGPGAPTGMPEAPSTPSEIDMRILQALQEASATGAGDAVAMARLLIAKSETVASLQEADRMLNAVGAFLAAGDVASEFDPVAVADLGGSVVGDLAEVIYAQVILSSASQSLGAGAHDDYRKLVDLLGARSAAFLHALLCRFEEPHPLVGAATPAHQSLGAPTSPEPLSQALLRLAVATHAFSALLREEDLAATQRAVSELEGRLAPWLLRDDPGESMLKYLVSRATGALDAGKFAEARALLGLMRSAPPESAARAALFAERYRLALQALEAAP